MNKYLSSFLIGAKQILQYRGMVIGDFLAQIITAFFLIMVWSALIKTDFTAYFIVVTFLIFGNRSLYVPITNQFDQELRHGWCLVLGKPIGWFSFTSLWLVGLTMVRYTIGAIFGMLLLFYMGISFSILTLLLSIPFIVLFEITVAYFISSFSYFIYGTWGIRAMINICDRMLGGSVIPLSLVSKEYISLLLLLPFANKTYSIAIAILDGTIPIEAYGVLIIWSIALFIIGWIIHSKGMERFESLGG